MVVGGRTNLTSKLAITVRGIAIIGCSAASNRILEMTGVSVILKNVAPTRAVNGLSSKWVQS